MKEYKQVRVAKDMICERKKRHEWQVSITIETHGDNPMEVNVDTNKNTNNESQQ